MKKAVGVTDPVVAASKVYECHRLPAGLVVRLVSIYRTMFRHRTSVSIEEKRIQERSDTRNLMMAALFALPMFGATAMAQDTVKIGWIDPLSGGGASAGERGPKAFQSLANELNAKGGVLGKQVEIVPFDNKVNPQESLIQ